MRRMAVGVLCAIMMSLSCGAAERAIDKSVVVDATVDQVWDSWTTREGIVSFFAPDAKVEPRVGGAFQIYFDPLAEPGLKGADDMRYMALQPKKMLSFDWNSPPSLPEVRGEHTFVVVRFESVSDKQTRVTMSSHRLGRRRPVGQVLCLFRPGLGQRARQPAEAVDERTDRLDRVDGSVAQYARAVGAEEIGQRGSGVQPRSGHER